MVRRSVTVPLLCFAALLASLALVACGDDDDAAAPGETVREILAATLPEVSPGHELSLARVVIPAGENLAVHVHPGPQLAWIAEGTLTYSVDEGSVYVYRNAGTPDEVEETIGPGQTTELRPGDSVIEPTGVVHSSRNAGDEPVVIFLATLFEEGAPLSSPPPGD